MKLGLWQGFVVIISSDVKFSSQLGIMLKESMTSDYHAQFQSHHESFLRNF
jgi:hypothetical protein